MNKTILNAVLFGALLATAGTFTSCKDYDDDINGLNNRVDAVEKSISDLKTQFGALAYVKSVSFSNGNLVVTDQVGKATSFTIPDTDTNTTYTLSVKQNGNKATITLTSSNGSAQSIEVSFTDTDTDTTLDPSLFWMDGNGVVWYGPQGDATKCKQTGITVPLHDKTTVTTTKYVVDGKTLGWDVVVDGVPTHLNILDVLPITGFSWVPEAYYNGIEAVEFPTYAYIPVVKDPASGADTTYIAASVGTFSSFPGKAKFYINPTSASLAQIAGGAKGATVLYKSAVNHTTRANINAVATISINSTEDPGLMTASIVGDLNLAETAPDKLDMLALRMTTTAGNTFTTNYFAVYNAKSNVEFTLVDKDAIKADGSDITTHKLATSWNAVTTGQQAQIDATDTPLADNAHLVQTLSYDEAIKGVDLNTLVNVALTKDGKTSKVNLADEKLAIEYRLCKYVVNGTDQINYATLKTSTLTAVNYGEVNRSCIGKTPVVKVTVKDTNNKNAVVAVAYIKLLYVADKLEVSDDLTTDVSSTLSKAWDCYTAGALDYTTTVEYMSTKVYAKVGSLKNLPAMSKEAFVSNYTFVTDQSTLPAEFKSKYITSITEVANADNADNRQIKFDIDEDAIKSISGDGTYKFFGVYKKNVDADGKYAQYPVYVAIPYHINVTGYPTIANGKIKAIDTYRIGQAWENGFAICKGSKETPNGAALYLDLAEAIDFDTFDADYAGHELEIVNPTPSVAMLAEEWCGNHGADLDWIVLKKQLTGTDEIIVPVRIYALLCNGDKVLSGTVSVKFVNPAKLTVNKAIINVKDGLVSYVTKDLKKYITITSSKDGSVLYTDGAVTEIGKRILGANPSINLTQGTVTPSQWQDKFVLNSDGTVTWNLAGQNTLAQGQNSTCPITFTIEYGKVKPTEALSGCTTVSPVLGGAKLTGTFTVKAWNAADYPASGE